MRRYVNQSCNENFVGGAASGQTMTAVEAMEGLRSARSRSADEYKPDPDTKKSRIELFDPLENNYSA